MASERRESKVSGHVNKRLSLADQTFQKPQNPELDKFWSNLNVLTNKQRRPSRNTSSSKHSQLAGTNQSGISIIDGDSINESQFASKLATKPERRPSVNKPGYKSNRIRIIDPVILQDSKPQEETPIVEPRSQTTKHQSFRKIDLELPVENRVTFGYPKSLKSETNLKSLNSTQNNSMNKEQQQQQSSFRLNSLDTSTFRAQKPRMRHNPRQLSLQGLRKFKPLNDSELRGPELEISNSSYKQRTLSPTIVLPKLEIASPQNSSLNNSNEWSI